MEKDNIKVIMLNYSFAYYNTDYHDVQLVVFAYNQHRKSTI